ncbi:hypothetical protein [Lacticaseibacillus parakribbianus]|uniref:hypothetical protein n=1 Tax=Lacticaseibacillus parakribbianus TaxID=2970927 RepID=UPI0021CB7FF2|nr:hypothetical protein [Lacticaseibacillus parakribbianus]
MATIKASSQTDLIDLTDGYSVILSNESHVFTGDTDSVSSTQTVTTTVMALCGSEQVAASVGTITGATGITAVSDGKTPAPTITITATSACVTAGTLTIPVMIGDITINKQFSYSIAFKGTNGTNGKDGAAGTSISVKSSAVTYLAAADGVTTPTTGTWSATIPSVPQGQYLWSKTVVTYSDGKTTTTYGVTYYPKNGTNGAGVTVSSNVTEYIVGADGTTTPTGTWATTIPTVAAGKYLWTRVTVKYSDGKSTVSYSVARQATDGTNGKDGANGADALTMVIISSAGTIFKNTSVATTLTAHVYKGASEVTGAALTALGTISWYKDGGTTAVGTGQTLTVAAGDVTSKASYTAQLAG